MAAHRPSILGRVVCGWDVGPRGGSIVYCAEPATHYTDHPHCFSVVCGRHAKAARKRGHVADPIPTNEENDG